MRDILRSVQTLKLLYESAPYAYDTKLEAWRILAMLDPQRENARQVLTCRTQLMKAKVQFWMSIGVALRDMAEVIDMFHSWLRGLGVVVQP